MPKAERLGTRACSWSERYGCYGCHKIKGWEGLRKVGPDLTKITSKTNEEWIYRWIKEPKGFRPTRMPQIWDVRIDETEEQKASNDVEANAGRRLHRRRSRPQGAIPRRPRATSRPGARPSRPWAAWPATASATTSAGPDAASTPPTFRTHGPQPRRHRQQGERRAGSTRGSRNPKGYWHETRMPNLRLSGEGGRRHHGLPDEPQERRLRGPRRGPRSTPTRPRRRSCAAVPRRRSTRVEQADAAARQPWTTARAHALPRREDDRPLRLLRLPHHRRLREDLAHRRGADRGGIEAGRAARLRLRGRQDPAHPARPGSTASSMEPRIFDQRQGQAARKSCCACPSSDVTTRRPTRSSPRSCPSTKEQVPLAAQKQLGRRPTYVEKGRRLVRNLQLPGLPPDRREGRDHPRGRRRPARGRGRGQRVQQRSGPRLRRMLYNAAVARSARARACRRRGCTTS